jgi:transcriptional regulator with XRE-family HTH domain
VREENIEFIALFEASGWTQAEVARQLHLDRSSVGKFLKGIVSPSGQTLKLFKLILADQKPEALTANDPPMAFIDGAGAWEEKVLGDLRDLHIEDRNRVLEVMRTMIRGLPKREPVKYSKPIYLAEDPDIKEIAERMVRQAGEEYDAEHKPKP